MIALKSICLVTADVPRLRVFYRAVLQSEPDGNEDGFCCFYAGGANLTIFSVEGMQDMAPGSVDGAGWGGCVLEFGVEDVDRETTRLCELGVRVVKPPTTQPWGLRSAWFRDPDGNIINFFAPVNPILKDPRAVVLRFFQSVLNERNLAVCDELLSDGYIDHDAPPDSPPGPASIKEYLAGFLADLPDLHVEVEQVLAEGSMAAARVVWHGRSRSTGGLLHKVGNLLFHFDPEGRIAERWSTYKDLGED